MYVFTNPPRLSLIALPKSLDKIYLFGEDADVTDVCAKQFFTEAVARLQTLEPNLVEGMSDEDQAAYSLVSVVCSARAFSSRSHSVVDLMELESRILAKCDPATVAIFEPEEYAGLVWLDNDLEKTLVFPSGAIIVHGCELNVDRLEESFRRKLPLIQKCMRNVPESLVETFVAKLGV